ncbi:hypothetical protein WA158_003870 [Blastocystis sp. Blastoise]
MGCCCSKSDMNDVIDPHPLLMKSNYKEENDATLSVLTKDNKTQPLVIYNFNFSNNDPDLLSKVRTIMEDISKIEPNLKIEPTNKHNNKINNTKDNNQQEMSEHYISQINQANKRNIMLDSTNIKENTSDNIETIYISRSISAPSQPKIDNSENIEKSSEIELLNNHSNDIEM